MLKFIKALSALAFIFIGMCSLASCGGAYNFYEDFYQAGATIEKDHNFVVISVDKAKEMIDNGDDFVLFLGTSTESTHVTSVTTLQTEFDYFDFEGKVYFIDTTDILSSRKKIVDLSEKLSIKSLDTGTGLVVAEYKDGKQVFDTSKSDGDELFYLGGSLSYSGVAYYIYLNYSE